MNYPKPGDTVKVTLTGEVMDKDGMGPEGYLWLQVPGYGPLQVPVNWVHVVKESRSIHAESKPSAPNPSRERLNGVEGGSSEP